jgi:hypothetical protein
VVSFKGISLRKWEAINRHLHYALANRSAF